MSAQNDTEIPGFHFDSREWSRKTSSYMHERVTANSGMRMDGSDPYFRARELEQIVERELNEEYVGLEARSLVPVESCDPGTQDIIVTGYGRTGGNARSRGPGAMDLPIVDVSGGEMSAKQGENWVGCRYTDRELAAAAKSGSPIDRDKMAAAHVDMEELFDFQLLFGDAPSNTTGLLNYHTADASSAIAHGDWDDPTTTDQEILTDFAAMVDYFRRTNPRRQLPNVFRFDADTNERLTTPIVSDSGLQGQSLLDVLQRRYPGITFAVYDLLDEAGTGVELDPTSKDRGTGGAPLCILYRKDRMVLRSWESRTPSPDPAKEDLGTFTIPWRQWAMKGCLWLRPLEGLTFEDHHT